MKHQLITAVIARASDIFRQLSPRGSYGLDVLRGRQRWSGADLRGRAKSYGGSYAHARWLASKALVQAGGAIIPTEHGQLQSAVYAGQSDYGDLLAVTVDGQTYVAPTKGRSNWTAQ